MYTKDHTKGVKDSIRDPNSNIRMCIESVMIAFRDHTNHVRVSTNSPTVDVRVVLRVLQCVLETLATMSEWALQAVPKTL